MEFRAGVIEVIGRERGRKRARRALKDQVRKAAGGRPVRIAIGHARVPDEAEAFRDEVRSEFDVVEDVVVDLGPVLAAIGGPGLLGITGHVVEESA